MSAVILAFKAPDRVVPPALATGKQALILAMLREINAMLDARQRRPT